MNLRNLCLVLILLICYKCPNIASEDEFTPSSVLQYWKSVEKRFILNDRRDIVLLLGITGSGKTSLGILMTEPELLEVIDDENTDDFILIDKKHRISENSTITSKTLVPELMVDKSNGTVYYDCPGFLDTRGLYYDITTAYFLRKLLEFAESVKLVFVINQDSVSKGGDRSNFITLAKHATTLIKDIDKYRDGIGMIVSKVFSKKKTTTPQVIVNGVVKFLTDTKDELAAIRKSNSSSLDLKTNENASKFVDIILDNEYKKIGLFRAPVEAGIGTTIPSMVEDREFNEEIITKHLKFVEKGDNDFAYTIAPETKNHIVNLLQDLSKTWTANLLQVLNEIEQFYRSQEKQRAKFTRTYDLLSIGYERFISINFTAPKSFFTNLTDVASKLNISNPIYNWKSYSDSIPNDEFYNILKIVTDDQHAIFFEEPIRKFNTLKQYIADSKNWYAFLNYLYQFAIDYNGEVDLEKLIVRSSIDEGELNIRKMSELLGFLNSVNNSTLLAAYNNISEEATANSQKLKALISVLSQTLYNQTLPLCDGDDTLLVTGYTIKISDVIKKATCWDTVKSIKLFALRKVIVDADIDKTGKNVSLAIIAPEWQIGTKIQIKLGSPDGSPHLNLSASNGAIDGATEEWRNGKSGEHGYPGGSAGNFIGIGNFFTNNAEVQINANGAKGGPGQNGGAGSDGVDGKDVEIKDYYLERRTIWGKYYLSFDFADDCGGNKHTHHYKETSTYFCRNNATNPGNGGDGGAGGLPGFPGNITVIGLTTQPSFKTSSNPGVAGDLGKGGIGGKRAKHGKYVVLYWPTSSTTGLDYGNGAYAFKDSFEYTGDSKNGEDGTSVIKQIVPLENPTLSIPNLLIYYKEFLRENLVDSVFESTLRAFLKSLEENEEIEKEFEIIDYVNEFDNLERQFFRLQYNLPFEPFLRSLLNRLDIFKKSNTPSEDDQKALVRLYAAIMSKLCAINKKNGVVLDLPVFLKTIKTEIDDLGKITKENNINKYRNKYKSILDGKIAVGQQLIKTQIEPEVEKIFEEKDQKLDELVIETIELLDKLEDNLIEAEKLQKRMQSVLFFRIMLTPLKLTAAAATLLGPAGAIAGTIGTGAIMLFESTVLDTAAGKTPSFNPIFGKVLSRITDEYKYENQNFKNEMEDLKDFLQDQTPDTRWKSFEKVLQDIEDTTKEIESGEGDATVIDTKKKELQTSVDSLIKEMKDDKGKVIDNIVTKLTRFQTVVHAFEIGFDSAGRIINDKQKLDAAKSMVENAKNELAAAKIFQQSIYTLLIPTMKNLEQTIIQDAKNFTGKSHIELDVSKWRIQGTLRSVKRTFDAITEPFKIHSELLYLFDRLNEAITVLIDIYDRFDAYADQAQFADFIANVASSDSANDISDLKLRDAVGQLDEIMRINILWQRYQSAIYGLKQHVFPFAEHFLDKFQLPNDLKSNDTKEIKRQAIEEITDLNVQVDLSKALHEPFHNDLVSDKFDETSPFYVWAYDDIKNDIKRLLKGESIFIKADVTKGASTKNAVKFNRLELQFNVQNETLQKELLEELSDFKIYLTMSGTNYYRCENKIYSISVDDFIEIYYSVRKDPDTRKPKTYNRTYKLIEENDFFLSPFVMWNITLRNDNNDFKQLEKFNNQPIDVLLTGDGQYLKDGVSTSGICGDNLNRFYDLENFV